MQVAQPTWRLEDNTIATRILRQHSLPGLRRTYILACKREHKRKHKYKHKHKHKHKQQRIRPFPPTPTMPCDGRRRAHPTCRHHV